MSTEKIEISVKNAKSSQAVLTLDAKVFGVSGYDTLVYDAVRWQRMKRRSGTHSTLTKGEVSGGGRKPFKQKGTGQARAGSNTSPLWVGGGISHGPQPRSYRTRLTARSRSLALAQVLSEKVKRNRLLVVGGFADVPVKTKQAKQWLVDVGVRPAKLGEGVILLVADNKERDQVRALRNLDGILILPVSGVNVFDLINNRLLLGSSEALSKVQLRVLGKGVLGKKVLGSEAASK